MKSGPEIVKELFSFRRTDGDTDYALRPEFTPTLARMFAMRASALPKPTRWFSIGPHFRAERPQRGRLREHVQWNVDLIGDGSLAADAQVVAVVVAALRRFGLDQTKFKVKVGHRDVATAILRRCGVAEGNLVELFKALDRRDRTDQKVFAESCVELGLDVAAYDAAAAGATALLSGGGPVDDEAFAPACALAEALDALGLLDFCVFDLGIVRGLAYYTGTVFEVHETSGAERAIAGGGRYDGLIELLGGPSTPAVGIAMGDVVIRLVLEEHGLLDRAETFLPRPDVFVISSGKPEAEAAFLPLMARLRNTGLHVRSSAKTTRNIGKLLGEASKMRARFAVILGEELERDVVVLKDLDGGGQREVALDTLAAMLRR